MILVGCFSVIVKTKLREPSFEALISTYGVVEHGADLSVVGDELVHEDHLAVVVVEGADLSEEQTK